MTDEPKAGEWWEIRITTGETTIAKALDFGEWEEGPGTIPADLVQDVIRRIPTASELAELVRERDMWKDSATRRQLIAERERDEARCEIDEACGLLGEGGDGTLKGRVESTLSDLHEYKRERDEARTVAERMAIIARDLQRYPCARHGVDTCPDQGCSEPTDLPWETDHD